MNAHRKNKVILSPSELSKVAAAVLEIPNVGHSMITLSQFFYVMRDYNSDCPSTIDLLC